MDDTDRCDRCDRCGGRLDRPGFYEPCQADHPAPDLAQRITEAVSREIHSRRGIGWEHLDDDITDDITDAIAEVVRRVLEREAAR